MIFKNVYVPYKTQDCDILSLEYCRICFSQYHLYGWFGTDCKSSLVSPAGILKILPVGSLSHAAFMYAAMKPSQTRPKFVKCIRFLYKYIYKITLTSTIIGIFI